MCGHYASRIPDLPRNGEAISYSGRFSSAIIMNEKRQRSTLRKFLRENMLIYYWMLLNRAQWVF